MPAEILAKVPFQCEFTERFILPFRSGKLVQLVECRKLFFRDSFFRHFWITSLAEVNVLSGADFDRSKVEMSEGDSEFPTHAGSMTNAIALARRICASHSFLSSSLKQQTVYARGVTLLDKDFFTIFIQYFVCLPGSSSIYTDISLKKINSFGASSFDFSSLS